MEKLYHLISSLSLFVLSSSCLSLFWRLPIIVIMKENEIQFEMKFCNMHDSVRLPCYFKSKLEKTTTNKKEGKINQNATLPHQRPSFPRPQSCFSSCLLDLPSSQFSFIHHS